jgi:HK97 family phage portal protein
MILSDGQVVDLAPQVFGETTPTLSNGYFYAKQGLALSGKIATYAALYRAQPSVATLVDKIANSGARLTFRVWDTTPETGKVEETTTPFARLMQRPCQVMSTYNFWRWTFSTYEVYGEAFWLKQRNPDTREVTSLIPMHPSRTTVKRDQEGNVDYSFTVGVASAGILNVGSDEVVPFLRYNPDSLMRGMSRLEPLRSTLLNEDASRRATQSWWKNGARPSVILKHPLELSQDAKSRVAAGFNAAYAGADNMGKAAVLEEGMDAMVIQLNAEEMQYIESRKLNLQEACMVYDVPPPVVHILDHATYSNITEQMRSMYRDTMSPRLEDFESVIEHSLRPDFYPDASRHGAFALDEVLRGDFETRATAVGNLIDKGVMKPSEARPMFDLPDAGDVADRLYGNAALVPLGSSVHGQNEVDPAGNLIPSVAPMGAPKPVEETSQIARSLTVRSVLAQVGRTKAAGGDARQTLIDEHAKALAKVFDEQRASAKTQSDEKLGAGWDDALSAVLLDLGFATAKTVGAAIAKSLGAPGYDPDEITDWLTENAAASAKAINETTVKALLAALDAAEGTREETVDSVFDGSVANRQASIPASRVALVAGLASLNSAGKSGAATKTWVTGPKPRLDHAEMNGETVGIGELFSNGMNAPGDPAGGADEVAGCNCSLEFS